MPKFNRIVDAEFAIGNTQQRIAVKNIPYVWNSDENRHDMDFPGVMAAIKWLRDGGWGFGLNLIMVSTRPADPQI